MRLAFIVFFSVITLIVAAGHYYFYTRLVKRTTRVGKGRRVGKWVFIALFALTMSGVGLSRVIVGSWLEPLVLIAMIWLGMSFYLLMSLGLVDLARLIGKFRKKPNVEDGQTVNASAIDESRRRFLARLSSGSALALSGAVTGMGVRHAWGDFDIPEVEIALARLPKELEGFRLIQVSDIHIGPTLDGGFMQRIVERVNSLKPDAVAITGDLVDGSVAQIGDEVKGLGNIEARFGRYFCSGNHEFYSNADEWLPFLQRHNVTVLGNRRIEIRSGSASFDLAGVHDHKAFEGYLPSAQPIIKGRDPENELILLAHQPVQIDLAVEMGAGLQLSGHTHGGQIFPFGYLTGLIQPYVRGHHHHDANTQIYVNRGTGYWGPPMRIGSAPEITQIILTSA